MRESFPETISGETNSEMGKNQIISFENKVLRYFQQLARAQLLNFGQLFCSGMES